MSVGRPASDPDGDTDAGSSAVASLHLYWIPLGAGNRLVQFSGRTFERGAARLDRRPRCDLYHSALVASLGADRYAIEMTPVPRSGRAPGDRGVVGVGAVGVRWAARLRIFRYEIRCWRNGTIPDLRHAVGGPVELTCDDQAVAAAVDVVSSVPTPTWGRDELGVGDMWNSNSVTAWVLGVTGLLPRAGEPPVGGRAPGWRSGVTVAGRAHARAIVR